VASSAYTSFEAQRHGFHFANNFTNHILTVLGNSITTYGRCGGMAWASLDYFNSQLVVPTHISSASSFAGGREDFASSNGVPHDGSVLADYIYSRLLVLLC
jgi:hypothetical protein